MLDTGVYEFGSSVFLTSRPGLLEFVFRATTSRGQPSTTQPRHQDFLYTRFKMANKDKCHLWIETHGRRAILAQHFFGGHSRICFIGCL